MWPSYLGFDSTSRKVEENLPNILEKFLRVLVSKAPMSAVEKLKDLLRNHVSNTAPDLLSEFSEAVRLDKVGSKDRDLVRGLRILQTVFEV